jgi:RNA polymerase sigma-70 factor (ECF subfamily)
VIRIPTADHSKKNASHHPEPMSPPSSTTLKLAPFAAVAPQAGHRLKRLVEAHFDFIGRVVRNVGVPAADIDDVLQRVFCAAAQRLDDIAPGSERAFLVQSALNWAANARRARARIREIGVPELPEVADEAASPEDLTDRRRAAAILDHLLGHMDLDLRTVFVLYEVEQMSQIEIADLLGVPQGTVASRLRRAREDFAQRLERWKRGLRMTGGAP